MRGINSKVNMLDAALLEIQHLPKSKGRRYSAEHRSTIAKAFAASMSVFEIHGATGIPIITLRNWRKKSFVEHFAEIRSEPEVSSSMLGPTGKVILHLGDHFRMEVSIDDLSPNLFNRLKNFV